MMENVQIFNAVSEIDHLLDFLYHKMTLKLEEPFEIIEVEDQDVENQDKERSFSYLSYAKQFVDEVWKILSKLNKVMFS